MLNIAFAGHIRLADLVDADICRRRLDDAFALLKAAGVESGRLLVGAAEGADAIAVSAWRQAGLGPIHAAHPFLHCASLVGAAAETWLDGASTEALGGTAHLDQTRWLLAYADLVVVLWNGAAPRGPGGTADIVMLGLARGAPILWVSTEPDDTPIRLLPSSYTETDATHLRAALHEFAETPPVDLEALASRIPRRATSIEAPAPNFIDGLLKHSLWRTFSLLRRVLGAAKPSVTDLAPPPNLQAQSGFALLSRRADEISKRAAYLSDAHRSAQVLLLAIALAATVLGASPAIFPAAKLWSSLAELGLLLFGLGVLLAAGRSHQHERWTELRCEAERLRSQRVAWVLGMTEPNMSGDLALPGAPPPCGAYDRDRLRTWGRWALAYLIEGQEAYHEEQAKVGGLISKRIKQLEATTFVGLLVSLAVFGAAHLFHVEDRLPPAVNGLLILIGAIGPAIGAACMTLEARFGFEEQRGRSLDLAQRFRELSRRISLNGSLPEQQAIAQAAMQLTNQEALTWRRGVDRRRLSRGG